jgi:hypothetical protein
MTMTVTVNHKLTHVVKDRVVPLRSFSQAMMAAIGQPVHHSIILESHCGKITVKPGEITVVDQAVADGPALRELKSMPAAC